MDILVKKEKVVYIGRTYDIRGRDLDHRNPKLEDSVFLGFSNIKEEIPEMTIIEKDLKLLESREREIYFIEYYKNKGYRLLNKNKGGGLGNIYLTSDLEKIKEDCKKVALTCNTLNEFRFNHRVEYSRSVTNGWLKEFYWLKRSKKIPWTLETARKELDKYSSLFDVRKNDISLYSWFRKNDSDYLNLKFSIKPNKRRPNWTLETAREEANKYNSRSELEKADNPLYQWLIRNDRDYLDFKFPSKRKIK